MPDSFAAAANRAPTFVRKLVLTLVATDGSPRTYEAGYHFDVLDATSEPMSVREGNLIPHLTAQQRTQLQAFVDAMLDKAKATIP